MPVYLCNIATYESYVHLAGGVLSIGNRCQKYNYREARAFCGGSGADLFTFRASIEMDPDTSFLHVALK
jgi:hypothetical protein